MKHVAEEFNLSSLGRTTFVEYNIRSKSVLVLRKQTKERNNCWKLPMKTTEKGMKKKQPQALNSGCGLFVYGRY